MRNLQTKDLYKISKILKKLGLKMDAQGKTEIQLGAELILSFFENLFLAENEANDWLGSLVGKTAEEFAELPIEETIEIIKNIKDTPGIADFFQQAESLTEQKS